MSTLTSALAKTYSRIGSLALNPRLAKPGELDRLADRLLMADPRKQRRGQMKRPFLLTAEMEKLSNDEPAVTAWQVEA